MKSGNAIEVKNVVKTFKVFFDKGQTLKEKVLFKNRRRYEERKVLDISFEVKKGEVVGLIGHNGCGKSTTLKLLTRIMYPDSGTIEMEGRISSLIELGAGFHPDMSGRQNIYTNASIFGLNKKEIDERLERIIDFSELGEYIDNPVRTYSSGMYTRLAFAVAINVDADILLIDEILAVGDTNFQAKCFNKMQELKRSGITIVFVTHDTGTVERFCDKAIWINDGKIMIYDESPKAVDAYLNYMNGKKIESLENKTETAVIVQNQEKTAGNTIQEIKTCSDEEHYGLKKVIITKACFVDEKGNETSILISGGNYQVCIDYKVNEPIDNYVFGIGIFTLNKQCIMGNNTQIDRLTIENLPQKGTVTCKLKELPLLTGKYILNVAIVDNVGTPMDYYRDYMHFDVVASEKSIGIVNIKHEWVLDND